MVQEGGRERNGSQIKETRKMLNWVGGEEEEEKGRSLCLRSLQRASLTITNLHLLQTDGGGTKPGVSLMYFSVLTCRVGLHLLLHSDHSAALQRD